MVLERVLGNMSWFLMMQRGLDLFWDNLNLQTGGGTWADVEEAAAGGWQKSRALLFE